MTDTATMNFYAEAPKPTTARLPTGAYIVTLVLYTGFAIPVAIVAMSMFGIIGLLLAAFLAWQWVRLAQPATGSDLGTQVQNVAPVSSAQNMAPTGNANFDAYRKELLDRLEQEQENFEGFLSRLRDAKDKKEFDAFMEDRAKAARAATNPDDTPHAF